MLGLSSDSPRSSPYRPRDHLENLFIKHGYPTPVTLSSLRELTTTSSTYIPPSPCPKPHPHHHPFDLSDCDPIDAFESLSLSSPSTQPIPIPRRPGPIYDDDLPLTPLTGRFDRDSYIEDWERASLSAKTRHLVSPKPLKGGRHSRMRSDHSPFISPVASPTMSPRRPSSPQPSRSRTQKEANSMSGFSLGSLPRFHPAVYQSSSSGRTATGQSPSPRPSRPHNYRTLSGPREVKWQFHEFLESTNQSPSAPRLDPLRSPGPVTPLALEAGDYLAAGALGTTDRTSRDAAIQQSGPPPELVDKLIARENEKTRQKTRMSGKGR